MPITALTLAARHGHVAIVRLLVEKLGASVNQADKNVSTALMMAASNKNGVAPVRVFVEELGANVHQVDKSRLDSLDVCLLLRNGDTGLVPRLLIEKLGYILSITRTKDA